MLNVAVLGKWHVHAWGYANETNTSKIAKVSAVWDADACRGKAWAEELKAEFIPELDEVLARKDIDAVIVGNETTAHFEVINKAALAGKHIFTEKALAPKLSECRIIRESVIKSGKNFVISYPHLGRPLIKFAKKRRCARKNLHRTQPRRAQRRFGKLASGVLV